jgi:RNA polymerase sigma factor (sigma-70 family)
MNIADAVIFIVDDDVAFRRSLERLLRSAGYAAETFGSAWEFLRREPPTGPACLILDMQLPEVSGLALQELLAGGERLMPIIFLTGYGTVPESVQAMKAGALDFLQKPCEDCLLLDTVARALAQAQQAWREHAEQCMVQQCLQTLTTRERDVLALVVTGMLNKQVANALGMSEKTVKVHRGRIMKKMRTVSLAELVRIADKAGITP